MAELASFCENCCFLEDKKCQHGLLDTFQERNARIEWENDFPIVYRVCPYRRTKEWNIEKTDEEKQQLCRDCLLYTSPSPRDVEESRMPSSA